MLNKAPAMSDITHVVWFEKLRRGDVAQVGGKNSSLGEMVQTLSSKGVSVPPGFATTADAYWNYIEANNLHQVIADLLGKLAAGSATLAETGTAVRAAFLHGKWPKETENAIKTAYRELSKRAGVKELSVAVRSSATAEDLPDASFAGQQETFLNIRGDADLLNACRRCYASLFTDRAISYRTVKGFDHMKVALSIGVQQMVRADIGGSGVMFSIDTETGFDKVVLINAAWGLGENVVQGAVDPDEYQVYKPLLANKKLMPIVDKKRGEKAIKMIYARRRHADAQRADLEGRARRIGALRCRNRPACPLGGDHRETLRVPDGHGVGARRRNRQDVHRAGATRDGAVASRRRHLSADTSSAPMAKSWSPARASATRSPPDASA